MIEFQFRKYDDIFIHFIIYIVLRKREKIICD